MEKVELRKFAKEKRKTLDVNALSHEICSQLRSFKPFQEAQNVLLFYPKEFEINLISLCAEGKNFYLPRVAGDKLLVCPYDCNVKLEVSDFKVLEPCSAPVSPTVIDLAVMPCLMADRKKFRLGYGGGFYDRFLMELSQTCTKVTVVSETLFIDRLPVEAFDLAVDYVVTEKGVY